jgi:hypothetical protein
MLRDHQLLVRRHDEEHNPTLRPRNERFAIRISRRVKNGAEPCKLLRDAGADRRRVFTNAGGEHEGIEPAQRGCPRSLHWFYAIAPASRGGVPEFCAVFRPQRKLRDDQFLISQHQGGNRPRNEPSVICVGRRIENESVPIAVAQVF